MRLPAFHPRRQLLHGLTWLGPDLSPELFAWAVRGSQAPHECCVNEGAFRSFLPRGTFDLPSSC